MIEVNEKENHGKVKMLEVRKEREGPEVALVGAIHSFQVSFCDVLLSGGSCFSPAFGVDGLDTT